MGVLEFFGKLFQEPDKADSHPVLPKATSADRTESRNQGAGIQPTLETLESRQYEADLQSLVGQKRARNEALIAGNVAIVGLEDIKEALGPSWGASAERVLQLAYGEIRKRLAHDDIMRSEEDGLFTICFASPSKVDAEEKAARISKEVKQVLLRAVPEFSATLVVRKYVAEVAVEEMEEGYSTLVERLRATMARLRLETESARLNYRKALLREFQIYYAPVWNPRVKRLVMNRCVLDLTTGFSTLSQFQAIADPDQMADTLAELDCIVLARALEALHSVRQSQPGAIVIVPVGYQTLVATQNRLEFGSLLDGIPESYRPNIVLEVTAVPAAATAVKVREALYSLSGLADRILLQLNGNPAIVDELDPRACWGITWSLAGWDRHAASPQSAMRRAVERAAARKLVTVAHGANSIGQAVAAVELGFDYLDGTAVHLNVDAPRAPGKLNPLTYPRVRKS